MCRGRRPAGEEREGLLRRLSAQGAPSPLRHHRKGKGHQMRGPGCKRREGRVTGGAGRPKRARKKPRTCGRGGGGGTKDPVPCASRVRRGEGNGPSCGEMQSPREGTGKTEGKHINRENEGGLAAKGRCAPSPIRGGGGVLTWSRPLRKKTRVLGSRVPRQCSMMVRV